MSILHIVDNKYRDLWGLYEIRKKLRKKNIKLFFCNKFNWNRAIKYINPNIIILPHIRRDSPHFQKIVHTAYDKKIKVICYPSESLDYRKDYLENEIPNEILDKIDKLFLWSLDQGQFVSEKHKNKIVVTGTTRFNSEELNQNEKIKTIGITSSGRYLAPLTGNNNILYYINSRQKNHWVISYLKAEVEFIDFLCQVIKLAKEKNINLVFKPHPFEKIDLYKEAFPDLIIENDPDIRTFLKKIDVCLNLVSSSNLQAFSFKIPVINITDALDLNKEFKESVKNYVPSKLGIPINNVEELKKLLINYSIGDLFKMNVERGDIEAFKKLVPKYETTDLISDELSKIHIKSNKKNFFNFLPYFIKEIYLIIMKSNRETLFRPFSKKDEKLLKKFS
jgi:surface carbohydrate biosynthesis protein